MSGGAFLRHERKAKRVSQRALANAVGVDHTYLSKIESEAMPSPSTETIIKIADHLQIDRDCLFIAFDKIPPDILEALKGNAELTRQVRRLMRG